jgi:ABC-2 type transport system permease protein
VDVYVPVLIAVALVMLAVNALPTILTSYREKGILRRLSVTPVPPSWVLATQLAINLAVAVLTTILIVGVGRLVFDVRLPRQIIGFVLVFLLAAVALLALGLLIAAIAPNGRIASGIGSILFFPLLFFAGLWLPQAAMPDILRRISDFSPLGAAVQALQDTMQGYWPHPLALAVMAAYAIVFGVAAVRLFHWE